MKKSKMALVSIIGVILLFSMALNLTQAQEFGTNWSAVFFPTNNLTGTGVTVSGINGLNFNWGTGGPIINGVPVAGMPVDNFSARFSSTQTFAAGNYTFTISSDDGVRVYIDGAVVLDKFIGRPLATDTFTRSMTAGPHSLIVEYFEGIDQAILQVQWAFGGAVSTAGPSPTPGPTSTPAPTGLPNIPGGSITGTVIRAAVLNVRASPSIFSDRVGQILRGQTYQIIGRDSNARWFLLQLSGYQGWVLGYYLYIPQNEFSAPVASDFVLGGNPSAVTGVVAQSFATVRLRAQPTIYAAQIGRITWGGAMAVTGRTPAGDWYRVVWKGTEGWAVSAYLRIVEGDLNNVPVVESP